MSWAKNPKDLYDVRVHRKGVKAAEEMAMEEKIEILKNQPWKKNTPEQQKCISTGAVPVDQNVNGKIKYSADEITIVIVLYGKHSPIYKAMMNGEKISLLIRKSIEEKLKQGKPKDEIEETLLSKCLKRESELMV